MLFIDHKMEHLTFLVRTRPAECACALLVFLVLCTCSLFLNAGQWFENSSQLVVIVLVLSCCGNGYKLEARATPVDDRRPRTASVHTGCHP